MAAIAHDGEAQQALLAAEPDAACAAFAAAAHDYRQSWEQAPPRSYGRLVGMLKAAVLGGGGQEEAAFVRAALAGGGESSPAGSGEGSPTAAYAQALAALICDEDRLALSWASQMQDGGEAFARTAEAISALAARDRGRYTTALEQIVHDFERRSAHLTGVAIADTALMLEVLAARRGISTGIESPLLPATRA